MDGSKLVVVVVVLLPFFAQSFRFVFALAKHIYWVKMSSIVIVSDLAKSLRFNISASI